MTANIISSGRSCGRTVFNIFMECIGGFFGGNINTEYFIHGNYPESRQRLRLTIRFVLV